MNDKPKIGLPPFYDKSTQILILGSLPGDESLARQEYYASKTNDFWKILSSVLEVDLVKLTYTNRLSALKGMEIGLWDVFHKGVRAGSADQRIAGEELNDFGQLTVDCPLLRLVCFNGKKAGEGEAVLSSMRYGTVVLPSSSGANRRAQKGRLEAWSRALERRLE